jgi:hypothetical protein
LINLLSLIPLLDTVPGVSIDPSASPSLDFSSLLTELVGVQEAVPAAIPATIPVSDLQSAEAVCDHPPLLALEINRRFQSAPAVMPPVADPAPLPINRGTLIALAGNESILEDVKKLEITIHHELSPPAAVENPSMPHVTLPHRSQPEIVPSPTVKVAQLEVNSAAPPVVATASVAPVFESQVPLPEVGLSTTLPEGVHADPAATIRQSQLRVQDVVLAVPVQQPVTPSAPPIVTTAPMVATLQQQRRFGGVVLAAAVPEQVRLQAPQPAPPDRPDRPAAVRLSYPALREAARPAVQETSKSLLQSVITSEEAPIVRPPQSQAVRVLPVQRVQSGNPSYEQAKDSVMTEPSVDSTVSLQPFQLVDAPRTLEAVEQAKPAQHMDVPQLPKLQVVRTVAMEIGEAESQVIVRIEDRGEGMNLHFGTGNEALHRTLESSIDSLVQALKREKIEVSNVEVSRKAPIDKVRRMKEAH